MTTLMLIGAAIGVVLVALLWVWRRPEPDVLVQLGRFDARHQSSPRKANRAGSDVQSGVSAVARLGRWVAEELARRGIAYASLRQDLALTGRTFEAVLARKVLGAVVGFLAALGLATGLDLSGLLPLPTGAAAVLAVLGAVVGFLLPDLEARRLAHRRREEFRRALGLYLELVSLEMAGSAAPAEALPAAARVGSGWPFALLRDTLFRSTRAGQDTWEALTELGERIGVDELRDLGALTRLVAHDGAQVRQSLTARASTMRRRQLAEAEGSAGQRDQAMRMAQAVIGLGFIVFLGYPALANILAF